MLLVTLSLLAASCQQFDKQVPSKDELLEKELKAIDWDEVDEFPSVGECDSIIDKVQRRQCFLDFLVANIQQRLNSDTLAVLYPQLDTIEVKITVFPNSQVSFRPKLTDSHSYGSHTVDSILQARLKDFPQIKPALKQGIPVKTQFILPVILRKG